MLSAKVFGVKKLHLQLLLVLILLGPTPLTANASEVTDRTKGIYVFNSKGNEIKLILTVTNLDKSGKQFRKNSKFKVLADCLVDSSKLPDTTSDKDLKGNIYTDDLSNNWLFSCEFELHQKDSYGGMYKWEQIVSPGYRIDKNEGKVFKYSFFDEVLSSTSSNPIYVDWDVFAQSKSLGRYFDFGEISDGKNDFMLLSSEDASNSSSGKTNQSSGAGEQEPTTNDGEEIDEDVLPFLAVELLKTNFYSIELENFPPKSLIEILATKKGVKSLSFKVNTLIDGTYKFKTSRNLRGYKLTAKSKSVELVSLIVR